MITLVLTVGLLATVDAELTVLLLLTAVGTVWVMRVAQERVRLLHKDFQQVEGDVCGKVADYLRGSRAVKLYAMEQQVCGHFDYEAKRIGDEGYRRDVQGHMQFMKQEAFSMWLLPSLR